MEAFYENKVGFEDLHQLSKLTEDDKDLKEVSAYLQDNNTFITVDNKGYCGQSGWQEYNVRLDGVNLSGNGYVFSKSNLINHIRTYKYSQVIKNTQEYKDYLVLHNKYKNV